MCVIFNIHVDLLLIKEENKELYTLIKDFKIILYDHALHCGRKQLCCYCLQAFSAEKKLKCHIKDFFKIDGKQIIKMSKNDEYVKLKNCQRKIKSPVTIYAGFEIILVPENNDKENPGESYKQISETCYL